MRSGAYSDDRIHFPLCNSSCINKPYTTELDIIAPYITTEVHILQDMPSLAKYGRVLWAVAVMSQQENKDLTTDYNTSFVKGSLPLEREVRRWIILKGEKMCVGVHRLWIPRRNGTNLSHRKPIPMENWIHLRIPMSPISHHAKYLPMKVIRWYC